MDPRESHLPPQELGDAPLVGRVAEGDQDALAELYDRYSSMLLALARRVLHDSSDAEEVLQEVFLQAWSQAGRYDSRRSSVSTWLALITRSRSIDRLRTRQVIDRTHTAAHQENFTSHASPEGPRSVWMKERQERLRRELGALPEEQREVLEHAFYRGLTQSEISSTTGIPLGTVKTRTLLAMKKLRKSLAPEVQDLL